MNRPKVGKTISFAVLAIAAIGMVILSTAIAKSASVWSDNDNHDDDCHNDDNDSHNHAHHYLPYSNNRYTLLLLIINNVEAVYIK